MEKDIEQQLKDLHNESPAKTALIQQIMLLSQLSMLTLDTLPISALLHAVTGAALLNKETELLETIAPLMEKLKTEAEVLLAAAKEESARLKEDKESNDAEVEDFFDKNDIIH